MQLFAVADTEKRQIVAKLLKDMWTGGHFSICTVDQCLKILEMRPPDCYNQWRLMHCVNWTTMPPGMPERLMTSVIQEFTKINIGNLIETAICSVSENPAKLLLDTMEGEARAHS